jgi:hypothetical protein
MRFSLILLIPILILVGCTDNTAQLTLEANYAQVGIQVATLRMAAEIQAARAETTLEFFGTRSAAAAANSQILEATLVALGFSTEAIGDFRQRQLAPSPTATITPTPAASLSPETDATRSDLSTPILETPTPTIPAVSPFAPVVASASTEVQSVPVVDSNAPHLENAVLATGVGADDCAVGVTAQFSTGSSEIYVVAEAVNLPSGSVIESRWFRDESPVGPVYDFVPDFDIERACIWFFVDPTDFEFIAGQYSVELLLNGTLAIPRLPFTITE